MQTEFYLFRVQGVTAEFRVKSVHRLGLSLSPDSMLLTVLRR